MIGSKVREERAKKEVMGAVDMEDIAVDLIRGNFILESYGISHEHIDLIRAGWTNRVPTNRIIEAELVLPNGVKVTIIKGEKMC